MAMTKVQKVGDIDVCFRRQGDGPPVVLVHGIGQDHRSWRPQLDAGIPGYSLFAYDVRGHGQTTLGEPRGLLDQLGDDLVEILQTITGPATCIGFSLGGTIVLRAAAQRPDLVSAVMVLATSSVVGKSAVPFYRQRIELVRRKDSEATRAMVREDTVRKAAHRSDNRIDVEAQVRERMEAMGEGLGYINAAEAMARMSGHPLQPLLNRIKCPVEVISGELDQVCPRRAAEILLDGIPQATFKEIPGAGHMLNVEEPTVVTASIAQFLNKVHRR